jgi:hypothetical protein
MTEFDEFERRLAAAIRSDADASVGPFEAGSIADAAIADTQSGARRLPRGSTRLARRFGRGRGTTLLAAAALLLVGGAALAGSGILRLPAIVPPAPVPSFGVVATASPETTPPGPSDLAGPSASPLPAAGPGGAWIATGTMGTPRYGHTAVRLLDGRVLVVGGSGDESDPATAELYDPASGTWSATGNMLKSGYGFGPTLLLDGRLLVGDTDDPRADVPLTGAEVYDPASRTWSSAGMVSTTEEWGGLTATVLGNGNVLVAGRAGAKLYDPASGTWSATGKMITPRGGHTATLLRDGKVLVAGGYDGGDGPVYAAELYDPDTGSWTATANTYRDGPSCVGCPGGEGWATLLQDGTLLFMRRPTADLPFAEIYEPATGTWTALAGPTAFGYQTATLLSDGTVLVAGLYSLDDSPQPPCTAAALYDPRIESWTTTSSMLRCGNASSFTPLLDGTVLVAGGSDCNDDGVCVPTGATELYVPAGVSPPPLPAFPSPPPIVFPSPTPVPTPFPPAAGPVSPNARSWTVTVDNESSQPVTLSVAAADGLGPLELVGSASPNVVPAGAAVEVTFLFPVNGGRADGWICIDLRPGDDGGLVEAADIGIPGKIWIPAEGEGGWVSP